MNSSEDDENEHENKAKPQPSQPRRRARYDNDSDGSYKNSSDGDDSDDGEWDKNTDDINSLATEELHRSRPNRWTGAASTWRSYTEQERRMHAALLGERRGDLSVHLYNAFAMRGRREEGETEGEGQDAGAGKRRRPWPSTRWTAWPMRLNEVPDDGVMAQALDDGNDKFTLRRGGTGWPSENLEGEVSATMLRLAKEKFWRRELMPKLVAEAEVSEGDVMETIESVEYDEDSDSVSSGDVPLLDSSEESAERKVETRSRVGRSRAVREQEEEFFTPVPSADDELSYSLLRPVTRRILARLDETLTILHNARMAGVRTAGGSDPEDTETERSHGKRGRPRKESPKKKHLPRPTTGRPRKTHHPKDGENHQEMLLRVARESKRRMPDYYGYEAQTEDEVNRKRKSRSQSRSVNKTTDDYIARWGTRDWRDVMAAAALAGFSPSVMARATQRCSTLFGQEMVLHTLPEQAKESALAPMQTVKYTPDAPPIPSSDEEDNAEHELEQLRAVSRQPSVRPSSESPEGRESSRRRRSATPGMQEHFCPHATCPRAVNGFSRRGNLARHLKTIHGSEAAQLMAAEEEDSTEEMDGAVHTDRFLKVIKTRRGWRSEDIRGRTRPRGSRYRTRSRAPGSDDEDSRRNSSSE